MKLKLVITANHREGIYFFTQSQMGFLSLGMSLCDIDLMIRNIGKGTYAFSQHCITMCPAINRHGGQAQHVGQSQSPGRVWGTTSERHLTDHPHPPGLHASLKEATPDGGQNFGNVSLAVFNLLGV